MSLHHGEVVQPYKQLSHSEIKYTCQIRDLILFITVYDKYFRVFFNRK